MFVLDTNPDISDQTDPSNLNLVIGFSTAHARDNNRAEARVAARGTSRRTARRTARRVNRRHDYYYSIPTGCTKIIINGQLYRYCSGIYYQEVVDSGDTVFVIVNP